ncbi:MAG: hypothetical protein KAI84_12170 [Gammaproteobacteria bacterium]|nr:hypothetical protein [Gammaproteobacteria bacterium]
MKKIVATVLALTCLISIAYAYEYSVNIIAGTERLLVEIDCPSEVQQKSKFIVNATITNPHEENVTDVIVELVAQKNAFSYGQPKKRIKEINGYTQTMVTWNVRAKQPGSYNITVVATGKTENPGESFTVQDEKTIDINPIEYPGLTYIIDTIRSFFRISF